MIPLFVPSSFGDIVTAANIVLSIYKALSDSMGASHEYQCLVVELRSFEKALRFVDRAITVAPPSGRDALDIAAETTTCLELLKGFHDRIGSYQKLLGGGKSASWRKIGWSLFKADEVASFRQKISQHKQNITLSLHGLTSMGIAYYADEARQSSASTREILLDLKKRLPISIGYGDGNSVTVINAFGNLMTFPLELCFSPDKLHDSLMTYFKGKVGEDYVKNHKYIISTKDGKSFAQANNWGLVVKVGTALVMSMIVEKLALDEEMAQAQRNACPHCYETDLGVMEDEGWLRCRRCERQFRSKKEMIQVQDMPRDHDVVEFRNIFIVVAQMHLSDLCSLNAATLASNRCQWRTTTCSSTEFVIIHGQGTRPEVFQSSKDLAAHYGIPEPTPSTTQSAKSPIIDFHTLSSNLKYLSQSMLCRNPSDNTNTTVPVTPLPTSVSPEELTVPFLDYKNGDLAKLLPAMSAQFDVNKIEIREMVTPFMDDYSKRSFDMMKLYLSTRHQDSTMDIPSFYYPDESGRQSNASLSPSDCDLLSRCSSLSGRMSKCRTTEVSP